MNKIKFFSIAFIAFVLGMVAFIGVNQTQVKATDDIQECTYDCPIIPFSTSHEIQVVDVEGHYIYADREWIDDTSSCPAGYEDNPEGTDCRQWVDTTYKTETETFEKDIQYVKSDGDCVKPSAESQGIPEWAISAYGELPTTENKLNLVCPIPTVEPTATPTETPTPTEEITPTQELTPTPTEEITPTPTEEVMPTPTDQPTITPIVAPIYTGVSDGKSDGGSSDAGATQAPSCSSGDTTEQAANPHIYRKGDEVIVKWWPTDGNKVHIYYKDNDSVDWQYSVTADNIGYFVIRDLGTKDITFAIQQVNDCSGGTVSVISNPIVDGDTDGWVLFR